MILLNRLTAGLTHITSKRYFTIIGVSKANTVHRYSSGISHRNIKHSFIHVYVDTLQLLSFIVLILKNQNLYTGYSCIIRHRR